jgi:hypothetical protein
LGSTVDDCLLIGKESSVSKLLEELKKHKFNLKIEKDVVEYLSCYIIEKRMNQTDHKSATLVDLFDSQVWRQNQRYEKVLGAWYSKIQGSEVY